MLCPMKFNNPIYSVSKECDGDICAWWDYEHEECSLLSINRNLQELINK